MISTHFAHRRPLQRASPAQHRQNGSSSRETNNTGRLGVSFSFFLFSLHLFLASCSTAPPLLTGLFVSRAIFNDPETAKTQFPVPVFQCLQIKPLGPPPNGAAGAAASERYRVVLSDVDNYVQTMLATQGNHVVHDGQLVRGCIVRIKAYQANAVKGKKCVVLLFVFVS